MHVIIDWVGTGEEQCQRWVHEFQQHGVGCRVFNAWFKRGLTRTHRKLCVIDRELAFIGGINVIDDFLSDHDSSLSFPFPRWDFAVKLLALAPSAYKEITAQWLKLGKMPLINRLLLARELRRPPKAQQGQGQKCGHRFPRQFAPPFQHTTGVLASPRQSQTIRLFRQSLLCPWSTATQWSD